MTTVQTEFLSVPLKGPGLNNPLQSQKQPSLGQFSSKCHGGSQGAGRPGGGGEVKGRLGPPELLLGHVCMLHVRHSPESSPSSPRSHEDMRSARLH